MRLKRLRKEVHRRRKTVIALLAVVILCIIGYYTIGLQVQFVLQEEMTIDLSPTEASFTVPYDEEVEVNFSLTVDNPVVCAVRCEHELRDLSTGEILDEQVTRSGTVQSDYTLLVDRQGEGQEIYTYQVMCTNVRSRVCSTSGKEYFKTALITVNHILPTTQKEAKQELQQLMPQLQGIAEVERDIEYGISLADALDFSSSQLEQQRIQVMALREKIDLYWEELDYVVLLRWWVEDARVELETLREDSAVDRLRQTYASLNESYAFLNHLHNITLLQDQADVFVNTSFEDEYASFLLAINEVWELNQSSEQLINAVDDLQDEYDFVEAEYRGRLDDRRMQAIDALLAQEQLYTALDVNRSLPANATCDEVVSEQAFIQSHNAQAHDLWNLHNLSDMQAISFSYVQNQTVPTNQTVNGTLLGDHDDLIDFIELPAPIASLCEKQAAPPVMLTPYTDQQVPLVQPPLLRPLELQEHEPLCCFKGDCTACCADGACGDIYPVVFLHGHAISEENRPENSHSSFGKMQRLLEEDGFINAGQLSVESAFSIPQGDWGRTPAPITIRLSYYIISYFDIGGYDLATQKTDKIENYAIRLKDLIETVKYRTGRDKVHIVAHSMGGLVAREYIALFGEESVETFIMVGTPNHGVWGRSSRLCSVTGASRECKDMERGSIFLKRLNTPQNRFNDIDAYTIRATGCETGGEDGDGIVPASSVPLNYTTNFAIEGECTDVLDSDLHTRILDPDEYPKTFEIIRGILVE